MVTKKLFHVILKNQYYVFQGNEILAKVDPSSRDVGLLPTITDFSSEATVMNLIKHRMMDSYFTLVQHALCSFLVKSSQRSRATLVNLVKALA